MAATTTIPDDRLVDEIDWEDTDVLLPGMDYKDKVLYVTIPANLNVAKTVGKGKNAEVVIEKQPGLACITSDGRSFPFTEEKVQALGFNYPPHVIVDNERRWSHEGIKSFLRHETTPQNPAGLFGALRTVYEQYVEFAREEYYDVMPLFVMGTYLFRLYKSLGYIHFNGTAASGKSQNLRILDALAFNTAWASSMSSAALYRSLAGHPGTVAIDEAEGWEGERGEELRRILNAGYLDGAKVQRVEKGANDQFIVGKFDSYGPKAIASINPLDNVIGSRCLIVAMRPAVRTIREFDKDDPRWQRLRDSLYLWMLHHASALAEVIEEWNTTTRFSKAPTLIGRQWQITQMYLTIADYIDRFDGGNRCATLIVFFTEYFESVQKQQDASDRIRLVLRVLPEVIRTKSAVEDYYYHIKTVHEVVSQYIEDDSKEYYKTRSVSKHLDVLGFKKRKASKQGQLVWLDPALVRQEFKQRRVEPDAADLPWLNGEVEYETIRTYENTAARPTTSTRHDDEPDDLWAGLANDVEEQD